MKFKEKMLTKLMQPIIDRLLHVTYDYFVKFQNLPFTDVGYNIYEKDILGLLKEKGVENNG